MSFRGISLEPIHKNIQLRLEELRTQHNYQSRLGKEMGQIEQPPPPMQAIFGAEAGDNHSRLSNKTVWYSLRSNAMTYDSELGKYVEPEFSKMGPFWDNLQTAELLPHLPRWETRSARPDFKVRN